MTSGEERRTGGRGWSIREKGSIREKEGWVVIVFCWGELGGVLYWCGEWDDEGWVVIGFIGLFKKGGRGGGSRFEGGLPTLWVFTKTMEVEGMVWRETSEVVSTDGIWGVRVAFGLKEAGSSRVHLYYDYHRWGKKNEIHENHGGYEKRMTKVRGSEKS